MKRVSMVFRVNPNALTEEDAMGVSTHQGALILTYTQWPELERVKIIPLALIQWVRVEEVSPARNEVPA